MPSPLQEGRTHVGADRSAQRGPEVLSLGGASRQEAGDPVAGLELRPVKSSLGDRPLVSSLPVSLLLFLAPSLFFLAPASLINSVKYYR